MNKNDDELDQRRRRIRAAIWVLLLLLSLAVSYGLAGLLGTHAHSQLTLVDDTPQALVDGNWTDISLDLTLSSSSDWQHATDTEIESLNAGLFDVYFAVHPVIDDSVTATCESDGQSCSTTADCCQSPLTSVCFLQAGVALLCTQCGFPGDPCQPPDTPACCQFQSCTANVCPTVAPTLAPTKSPTVSPTPAPTATPTKNPTRAPTPAPTATPTKNPTSAPTPAPTATPTKSPTKAPTVAPTTQPTVAPTKQPTVAPTAQPTVAPTTQPTVAPTTQPTVAPTTQPTTEPTNIPLGTPTLAPTPPTTAPTTAPTVSPTVAPTVSPTVSPTAAPTATPTVSPTVSPTKAPTMPVPCGGTFTTHTRILRKRLPSTNFYQVGPIYTPDAQMPSTGNAMLITVTQLDTQVGDVYRFQWITDDCPSTLLTPTPVDVGLLGVPNQGVLEISSYVVIAPV